MATFQKPADFGFINGNHENEPTNIEDMVRKDRKCLRDHLEAVKNSYSIFNALFA
jgi:hypothetical protein